MEIPCALTVAHDVTERRQLERELLEISERERQRIGYDLHDSLGQHLTGIAFLSKVLAQRLKACHAAEAAEAAQIVVFVNQAIEQARKLARGLAPVTLETYGLVFALQELATSVEALFHLSCQVRSDHAIHITDHAIAIHLYRMVQESVNNAVQHGKAQHITITLAVLHGCLTLTVHDDGMGFSTVLADQHGMGLRIMHHRARMIGATLEIQRGPQGGTSVICTLANPALVSVNQVPSGHPLLSRTRGRALHRSLVAIEIARHIAVVAPHREQRWAGGRTLRHGVRTPRAEATARGRIDRIRRIPHKRRVVQAFVRIHGRSRGKQRLRVGMQRRCGDVVRRCPSP